MVFSRKFPHALITYQNKSIFYFLSLLVVFTNKNKNHEKKINIYLSFGYEMEKKNCKRMKSVISSCYSSFVITLLSLTDFLIKKENFNIIILHFS